jgi:glutamine amidotransferase
MIAIVDYGMGNVGSVRNALAYLGAESEVTAEPERLHSATHVILPGVGSFVDGMRNLEERGLIPHLRDIARAGRTPLLGICLGMQLFIERGEEGEGAPGLGLLPGIARRLAVPSSYRVPHVGWNDVIPAEHARLFAGIKKPVYYFVHGYHVVPVDRSAVAGTTEYGETFVSAIEQGLIFGVQFHPEKSQQAGLALLENFLRITA